MAGNSRLQINVEVRTAVGVPFLGNLKDGMILPLFWIEVGANGKGIPEKVLEILRSGYFTAISVEMALQWGSLIAMILSLSAMIACLWKYRAEQHVVLRRSSFVQNNLRELLWSGTGTAWKEGTNEQRSSVHAEKEVRGNAYV